MMSAKQQSTTLLNAIRTEILHEFAQRYDDLVLQAQQNAQQKQEYSTAGNEQKQLQQARQALYEHRQSIVSIWPSKLAQLSERALQTVYHDDREASRAAKNETTESPKGGLSLLEFDEFEHSLRFDKLIHYMRNQAGQQLIDLNIRLAVMYGQDDIKERENPFRPYIFARSIALTLDQLRLPQLTEGVALSLLGEPAAQLLYGIYQLANAKLEAAGFPAKLHLKIAKAVQRAALQTVDGLLPPGLHNNGFPGAPLPIPPSIQRAAARNLSPQQQLSNWLHHLRGMPESLPGQQASAEMAFPTLMDANDEKPPGFGDFLRRMLANSAATQATMASGNAATGDAAPLPNLPLSGLFSGLSNQAQATQPAGVHDIVKMLGQMHKTLVPESNAMVAENGAIRSLLLEQKNVLLNLTQDEKQRQTIDMVALLFEVLLRDSLLSLDLRLQLGRLQFLYLQLALKEPAFLSQQHHPARQLINRFCTVSHSAGYMNELKDKIDDEINRIMRTLLRHDCEVPELFARLLARFETLVTREFRAASTAIRRTVKVIAEAEMRSMRVANIREKLAAAFAHVRLDSLLKEFLEQDWARVIEYAERTDKRMARCFRLLVPDMVWSCYPKHGQEQMTQLNAMLPTLLSHLKQGLQLLRWDVQRQQTLLDHLAHIHGQNLRRHHSVLPQQAPAILSVHEYFDSFTNQDDLFENNQLDVDDAAEYWPEIAEELGLPIGIIAHEWVQSSAIVSAGAEKELQEVVLCGSLLRLKHGDRLVNASVHWINPSFANMVLALHGGNDAILLSSIDLHQLLIKNKAQLIEPDLCFDRAILQVLQTADAMDALNAK